MAYTSDNPNFMIDLETNFKKSIYCLYYILKGVAFSPSSINEVLRRNQHEHVRVAEYTLEYLGHLNNLVAELLSVISKKDYPRDLDPNSSLQKITEEFDLIKETIEITKWGPCYWKFLHYASICMNIGKGKEKLYDLFYIVIYNIGICLPCSICYENYQSKLEDVNVLLIDAKTDAIKSIYDLHSLVNKHTKPQNYVYTFEEFLVAYDLKYDGDGTNAN